MPLPIQAWWSTDSARRSCFSMRGISRSGWWSWSLATPTSNGSFSMEAQSMWWTSPARKCSNLLSENWTQWASASALQTYTMTYATNSNAPVLWNASVPIPYSHHSTRRARHSSRARERENILQARTKEEDPDRADAVRLLQGAYRGADSSSCVRTAMTSLGSTLLSGEESDPSDHASSMSPERPSI